MFYKVASKESEETAISKAKSPKRLLQTYQFPQSENSTSHNNFSGLQSIHAEDSWSSTSLLMRSVGSVHGVRREM